MSFRLAAMVWELDLPMNEKLVMMALADHADDESFQCWPSQSHLAKKCGCSEDTVMRLVGKLAKKNLLSRARDRRPDGTLGITRYSLKLGPPRKLPDGTPSTPQIAVHHPANTPSATPQIAGSEPISKNLSVEPIGVRKRPRSPIPENFTPDPQVIEWAGRSVPGVNTDREREKFIAHALSNDRRLVDWQQAFKNWLLKADEFRKPDAKASRKIEEFS